MLDDECVGYYTWILLATRLVKVGFTKHISVVVSIICLLIFTLIQAEEKNSMFQLGRLSRLDNIVSHCKLVLKSLMFVTWDRSCN